MCAYFTDLLTLCPVITQKLCLTQCEFKILCQPKTALRKVITTVTDVKHTGFK